MEKTNSTMPDRREFLGKIIPVCSLACIAGSAFTSEEELNSFLQQQGTHKFQHRYDRPISWLQYKTRQVRPILDYAKAVERVIGKEKTIEIYKQETTEGQKRNGERQASRIKDNSFKVFTDGFRNQDTWRYRLTYEIVEDSEKAFEMKVTECLSSAVYLRAQAGDYGYAIVCLGDYTFAEGFNPKIKLIRDKTLMQGHKYCNHRYIWMG